jgi:hypothetical protein
MSGSKGSPGKQPPNKTIPIRRVPLTDQSQLPSDYSATPGGTLFSTTPGGTRIIYDRDFLMQCRHSPLALSPPANLPHIPGVTEPANHILAPAGQENPSAPPSGPGSAAGRNGIIAPKQHPENAAEDAQFQMDI